MTLQKLEELLKSMEGHWFSQRTTHYINTKRVTTNEVKNYTKLVTTQEALLIGNQINFNIHLNNKSKELNNRKIIYRYIITKISELHIQGVIEKSYANSRPSKKYTFVFFKNYLKIYLSQHDINYIGYIYFINSKFIISATRTKFKNQYTALNFCSNIKIDNR